MFSKMNRSLRSFRKKRKQVGWKDEFGIFQSKHHIPNKANERDGVKLEVDNILVCALHEATVRP